MSTVPTAKSPMTIATLKGLYDDLWCATQNLHRSQNGTGSAAEEAGMARFQAQQNLEDAEKRATKGLRRKLAQYKKEKPLPKPMVFA